MTNSRPRVFFDIQIGTSPAGRITIELFADKTPKTCENFCALATASYTPPSASQPLTYKQSPFHRIIDEFMVQGGDITKGDGTGGASIYGGDFEDENIGWREIDSDGLVCMANRGKGTNSSQFFITLAASPHLNGKHTIFGHVVAGQHVLGAMAKVPVDKNDRPLDAVLISHCGELEPKQRGKKPTPASTLAPHLKPALNSAPSHSIRDRGRKRRRRSTTHGHERSASHSRSRSRSPPSHHHHRHNNHPSPRTQPHPRRRSDIDLDSTLRGRTLTRSPSCPRPAPRNGSPHPRSKSNTPSPPARKRHRRNRNRDRSPSRSRSASRARVRSASPHLRRLRTRSRSRSRSRSVERGAGERVRGEGWRDHDYGRERERERGRNKERVKGRARQEEEDEEMSIQRLEEEREREGGEGRYSGVLSGEGEDGGEGMRWRGERRGRADWGWGREGDGRRGSRSGFRDGGYGGHKAGNAGTGGDWKGRVAGGDGGEEGEGGEVRFKGRGSMKYRERRW